MVPVRPHPSIPRYRVIFEATARAGALRLGGEARGGETAAAPASQPTFPIEGTRAPLTILPRG